LERPLSKKRRSRRRLRIAKRLLLLGILSLLVYGLVVLGGKVYRWVLFPAVRYEQAKAVDSAIFVGHALVLRDELALVAPRGGALNILVDHGSPVRAGENLFELVDMSLLSALDRQLEEIDRAKPAQVVSEEEVAHRRQQLAEALAIVRNLAADLAKATRFGNASSAERAWRELTRAQRTAKQREENYAFATRTEVARQQRRAELISQRNHAIHTVRAPAAGFLSFAPGGPSDARRTSDYGAVTLDDLRARRNTAPSLRNGDQVSAGQVVCLVVDASAVVLLVEMSSDIVVPDVVDVALGGLVLKAKPLQRILTAVEGVVIMALRIERPPFAALEQRSIEVRVLPHGVVLSNIPTSAIVSEDGNMVYIKEEDGKHSARKIVVVERKGSRAIVQGLSPEELVVVNPGRRSLPGGPP